MPHALRCMWQRQGRCTPQEDFDDLGVKESSCLQVRDHVLFAGEVASDPEVCSKSETYDCRWSYRHAQVGTFSQWCFKSTSSALFSCQKMTVHVSLKRDSCSSIESQLFGLRLGGSRVHACGHCSELPTHVLACMLTLRRWSLLPYWEVWNLCPEILLYCLVSVVVLDVVSLEHGSSWELMEVV